MTTPGATGAVLPLVGDTIGGGKYKITEVIGQGGMGAVFGAMHLELDKEVAVKVMLADTNNREAMERFKNEGRAAAKIESPHVVKVYDVAQEFGFQYMVLERLRGKDLGQLIEALPGEDKPRKMPPHLVVRYLLQGLRGVAEAHKKGIIHRDLKPTNLFLHRQEDGAEIVKVLDFGISKASANPLAQTPSNLTSTKAMLGSPLYMSPEQLRSSKKVDHRADIWAIGVIMYELLTGELPFGGENLGELFAAILETDAPSVRLKSPEVPEGLDRVVRRCLLRNPDERYQSINEISVDLQPFEAPGAGLMATAFLGQSAPHFSPQVRPSFGAVTPGTPSGQVIPPMAAMTPSGAGPRPVAAGTMAMGRGTNGGWQNTGPGVTQLPKSKAPLVVGAAFAAFLVFGAIGVVAIKMSSKATVDPSAAGSAPTPPTTSVAATNTPPPPTASAAAEPTTPSASATTSSSAPTAAVRVPPQKTPPPSHVGGGHAATPTAKVDPLAKPPVDPPAKPTATAPAKPAGTGIGTQNTR